MRPKASGRLTKQAIELEEHDISYKPWMAIKAQALIDFLAGTSGQPEVGPSDPQTWNLYLDDSSSQEGYGAGLLLECPEGQECCYFLHFKFRASNNEVEYEALIARLSLTLQLRARQVQVFNDSQLIVKQVFGEYEAKEDNMLKYLAKLK